MGNRAEEAIEKLKQAWKEAFGELIEELAKITSYFNEELEEQYKPPTINKAQRNIKPIVDIKVNNIKQYKRDKVC